MVERLTFEGIPHHHVIYIHIHNSVNVGSQKGQRSGIQTIIHHHENGHFIVDVVVIVPIWIVLGHGRRQIQNLQFVKAIRQETTIQQGLGGTVMILLEVRWTTRRRRHDTIIILIIQGVVHLFETTTVVPGRVSGQRMITVQLFQYTINHPPASFILFSIVG